MRNSQRLWVRGGTFVALLWLLDSLSATVIWAHPLGNFTINHYSRIELSGDTVAVRYVLDFAEVPSVQERLAADSDGDGSVSAAEWDAYKQRKAAEVVRNLELSSDGQPTQLEVSDVAVSQPLGQGDIPLVRIEMWFRSSSSIAPNIEHHATLHDRTDAARIGWREMVVHAGRGATITDSDAPAQDVTDELRSYPDDMLQDPLDRRDANWSFSVDGSTGGVTVPTSATAVTRPSDPFAALVTATDLNPAVIVLALLGAAALGGIHAASPGHGKTVMAAYLVGTRGTILHAATLAMSVTIAHTLGVLVLGVLTVLASNLIFPDRLYPWLTLTSGAVVLIVGGRFLILALRRGPQRGPTHTHHSPDHAEGGDHDHVHDDALHAGAAVSPSWRGLFALGLAGGIVPSGSALVVLLSSVALGRLGFGLTLIVAFGFGMAVVLVTTGVLLVHAGRLMLRLFPRTQRTGRLSALVPLLSAVVMTLLGVAATLEGLSQTGLIGT